MERFIDRIYELIQVKFENNNSLFSKVTDIDEGTVSKWKKSEHAPNIKNTTREKLKAAGINPDWLFDGVGQMDYIKNIVKNVFKGVPYYPIDVTATFTRSFNDIEEKPEFYIDYKPFNDCDACFPVFGDSMYPMFNSGDVIAVRKVTNPDIIMWGEPHFIVTNEFANNMKTIKLLYPCDSDNNCVILRASNPNYKGDMIVPKDSILNIFIVKGKINQRIL